MALRDCTTLCGMHQHQCKGTSERSAHIRPVATTSNSEVCVRPAHAGQTRPLARLRWCQNFLGFPLSVPLGCCTSVSLDGGTGAENATVVGAPNPTGQRGQTYLHPLPARFPACWPFNPDETSHLPGVPQSLEHFRRCRPIIQIVLSWNPQPGSPGFQGPSRMDAVRMDLLTPQLSHPPSKQEPIRTTQSFQVQDLACRAVGLRHLSTQSYWTPVSLQYPYQGIPSWAS